jgi:hypothetical protein
MHGKRNARESLEAFRQWGLARDLEEQVLYRNAAELMKLA